MNAVNCPGADQVLGLYQEAKAAAMSLATAEAGSRPFAKQRSCGRFPGRTI